MADSSFDQTSDLQCPFSDQDILAYLTAAQGGDVGTLQEYLARGMPVDTPCLMFAETGLTKACRMGEEKAARLLCDWGADVNSKTGDDEETPLHIAVMNRKFDIMKFLLASGADPNMQDSRKRTPLMLAASMGNPEVMKMLIAAGSELNTVDWKGMCAMHHCFCHYQGRFFSTSVTLECVQILVEAGADMNIISQDYWTPCSLAVGRRLMKLVRYLLLQNCDPDGLSKVERDPQAFLDPGKRTPLCIAAVAKDVETVKILLQAGSSHFGSSIIKDMLKKDSVGNDAATSDARDAILEMICQPRSLMESCRVAIRNRLRDCSSSGGTVFLRRVESLNLPQTFKDFILLKDLENM